YPATDHSLSVHRSRRCRIDSDDFFFILLLQPPSSTIFPYTTLFRSHEFGHFLLAKASGIKVNEFAIGMGPAIFKKQGEETLYSRSEEHTSELQSRFDLVCRLLLEKKKNKNKITN